MLKTTTTQKKFWQNRKIDWDKQYLATWDHPHRELIMRALSAFDWVSLWEVGCGPGANLVRIAKTLPITPIQKRHGARQLGGSDINPEAIALAKKTFEKGLFHVEAVDDLLLSDDSVDVVLSDATLIYYGPEKIDKAVGEMVRIARLGIVLCEFHGTSWWKRLWLRLTTGYNAYNYQELLEKHGCRNIQIVKIPPQFWDGFPWQPWGHIVIAQVTNI